MAWPRVQSRIIILFIFRLSNFQTRILYKNTKTMRFLEIVLRPPGVQDNEIKNEIFDILSDIPVRIHFSPPHAPFSQVPKGRLQYGSLIQVDVTDFTDDRMRKRIFLLSRNKCSRFEWEIISKRFFPSNYGDLLKFCFSEKNDHVIEATFLPFPYH